MEVEIRVVPGRKEPAVVIEAPALTGEAQALAEHIGALFPRPLTLWQGDRAVLTDPGAILRFYADGKGVLAQGRDDTRYTVRARLYELEERLDPHTFVRISQSEIVNLRRVTALDLSLTGTIKMTLEGGTACYVSRRYVKKIKEAVGL